ncbi:MAG: sugar phosphate isomerase/epimerase [Chloroflexi bacterium]|nr:sugar phosphate isomerase/epimerase [Chloroflexota bacterium]
MTRFILGINLGFATNRFPEAEVWARIVREELGLASVQLVADLLNPFWPEEVIEAEVTRIERAVNHYGIEIHSLMTSTYTRVNHLMHPHPETRQAWSDWFARFAGLAARLGARAVGSHFGILSVQDLNDPFRYRQRVDEAVCRWQELSYLARDLGLQYLFFETMSIPREMGWTIAQARRLYERVNRNAGVPFVYCLDVGHAPHPKQRDPYLWLRELGRDARLVHLQQTEFGHSHHWPFTSEYNRVGIIDPRRVLDTLAAAGAAEIWLGFEISHREKFEIEPRVIPDLVASSAYWRRFLPVDGSYEPTERAREERRT